MTRRPPRYKKILLKVSGEVLMGDSAFGIDMNTVANVAEDIKEIVATGVELCLVIGAGQPAEGQDFVELRAKTVSGDVRLQQR